MSAIRVLVGWCAAALGVIAWCFATAWPGIVHGHPAYAVLLSLTALLAVGILTAAVVPALRRPASPAPEPEAPEAPDEPSADGPASSTRSTRRPRRVLRLVGRVAATLAAVGWLVLLGWLRPFPAVEPALAAMASDDAVKVTETASTIVLTPTGAPTGTGVLFQPGARVDARAYVAALRPTAEQGAVVVVVKQPLGIGFLALGALGPARSGHPEVERWVVAGHSLGGTVASLEADGAAGDPAGEAPVVGLLLWASYPASDISGSLQARVLSVSGSEDGLATPAQIEASRASLPAGAQFVVVEGGSHAQFGAYGPQPGDGEPTISDDDARQQVADASAGFVASFTP